MLISLSIFSAKFLANYPDDRVSLFQIGANRFQRHQKLLKYAIRRLSRFGRSKLFDARPRVARTKQHIPYDFEDSLLPMFRAHRPISPRFGAISFIELARESRLFPKVFQFLAVMDKHVYLERLNGITHTNTHIKIICSRDNLNTNPL